MKDLIPKTSHWNYRVFLHYDKYDYPHFKVHEVYYSQTVADGYIEKPVCVETELVEDLPKILKLIELSFDKPMIFAKEFPREVIVKYKCSYCENDTFDEQTAHLCNGRYKKRRLKFETIYK